MDAGQLFDQVFFDRDVEPAARRGHLPAVGGRRHVHAQRAQDALDLGIGDLDAEHAGDARTAQGDRGGSRQVVRTQRFGDRARGAAGQVQDQAGSVLDGGTRQRRVDAALEAMAGIGMQAQLAATAHDRGGREVRRLQEHGGGVIGDTGVEAAHQASQRDRAIGVGDDQEAVVQRGIAAVQQFQRFAGTRTAHADAALQGAQVEGVHRLAQLQHHVLGDIHQQRHRAHATATQALGHPQRSGRARVDALDDATDVTRRLGACGQCNGQFARPHRRDRRGGERHHFTGARGGHVEGDAADAEAIGTVGGQLDLDAGVGQAEVLDQRLADRRIGRQLEQARGIAVQAQFLGRAQHAVGLHAAQLGRLDRQRADLRAHHGQRRKQARACVRRAADDLQVLALPRVDLADLQAIGFGMTFGRDNARDHDVVQARAERGDLFHFQADGGQHRAELFARGRCGNVAAQPVFREFHGVTLVGPAHAPGP